MHDDPIKSRLFGRRIIEELSEWKTATSAQAGLSSRASRNRSFRFRRSYPGHRLGGKGLRSRTIACGQRLDFCAHLAMKRGIHTRNVLSNRVRRFGSSSRRRGREPRAYPSPPPSVRDGRTLRLPHLPPLADTSLAQKQIPYRRVLAESVRGGEQQGNESYRSESKHEVGTRHQQTSARRRYGRVRFSRRTTGRGVGATR